MRIEVKDLSFVYNEGNVFCKRALDHVSLTINQGEFIGVIGHTGSGKSTLLQHFNGLLVPTDGKVFVDGLDTGSTSDKNAIRQKVGMVFQYPEYQLFEETCYQDIAFGPKNIGLNEKQVDESVRWACQLVGLDYERMKTKSPFELSGGQKRRVAIAGVLAMKPEFLILDEPTAGLDPVGRDEILAQIYRLYQEENMTIVLVTHSMEDIAKLATRIVVIDSGKILMDDTPKKVFEEKETLSRIGLAVPQVTDVMHALKKRGYAVRTDCITVQEAFEEIKRWLEEQRER